MSRERPILMNGDMVRAILDGSKTQTRRPLSRRLAAEVGFIGGAGEEHDPHAWGFGDIDGCWHVLGRDAEPWFGDGVTNGSYRIQCEIGEVGDTLWVREAFLQPLGSTQHPSGEYESYWTGSKADIRYRADGAVPEWTNPGVYGSRWRAVRPSIHMPRWASRLSLRVTGVRVERVQDITEEDARAEGVEAAPFTKAGRHAGYLHVEAFEDLWNEVYGTWDANPWVWAISFEVVP